MWHDSHSLIGKHKQRRRDRGRATAAFANKRASRLTLGTWTKPIGSEPTGKGPIAPKQPFLFVVEMEDRSLGSLCRLAVPIAGIFGSPRPWPPYYETPCYPSPLQALGCAARRYRRFRRSTTKEVQVPFCVERRHTPRAGACNGLAIEMVLHVARCKNT